MNAQDINLSRPKLTPVEVPWKIALSTPLLKLVVAEFAPRTAEFIARFLPDQTGNDEKIVTVTFEGARWLKISPAQSEGNVVDEQAYDWSDVKLRPKTADDIKEWMHMFNEQWNASGICPDPNMYQVQNSDWIASTRDSNLNGYKHLLLLGEEMYVEVLCNH